MVVSLFVLLCVLCVCAFMGAIGVGVCLRFSCFFGCLSVPTLPTVLVYPPLTGARSL